MSETQELHEHPQDETELYYTASVGLRSGRSRTDMLNELTAAGAEPALARRMVEEAYDNLSVSAQAAELTFPVLLRALAGATIGAGIGALGWWLILAWTGYEIGLIAVAVGWLAGMGTRLAAGRQRGFTLQVLAVSASVAGIVFGNFFTILHVLNQGDPAHNLAPTEVGLLSPAAPGIFLLSLLAMFDGWNLLWILLAVTTSWGMLKGEKIQLNSEPVPA